MIEHILRVVRGSDMALTAREICCALNGKPRDYCMNVDGSGARCVHWYSRPRHEKQRIRLAKPDCRVNPTTVLKYLKRMVEMGLLKRWEEYLPDPMSKWDHDRHTLYYVTEDQLRKRLAKELGKPLF